MGNIKIGIEELGLEYWIGFMWLRIVIIGGLW
jgi:hypothetical protein